MGDEDLLEDEEFLERFGMCEEWTEEEKEVWAQEKTEKGEKEKKEKGMNCDKFKDSEEVDEDGQPLYERCLALRAICEEAKETSEEMPEECVPPEKEDCHSDDAECLEEQDRRGRGLRRILLEDTEYTASEAPKCKPVDFDQDKSKSRRDDDSDDSDESDLSYYDSDEDKSRDRDDSDDDRSRGDRDDSYEDGKPLSCDGDDECIEMQAMCEEYKNSDEKPPEECKPSRGEGGRSGSDRGGRNLLE